jgi:hypothetical protein
MQRGMALPHKTPEQNQNNRNQRMANDQSIAGLVLCHPAQTQNVAVIIA